MGTGKTQFTKSLIAQLYRNQADNIEGKELGILIFDYKGDYNESNKTKIGMDYAMLEFKCSSIAFFVQLLRCYYMKW